MLRYFDTHAHLSARHFDEDRDALVASLPERGVALVVECGTEPEDWEAVKLLSERDFIYAAYGVHPHSAADLPDDYLLDLSNRLRDEKCVALGEIGLDYHYDFSPRDVQERVLREQLALAVEMDKPVILHDREAHDDMLAALKPFAGKLRGVMHCFSGSAEMTKDFVDLGLYLGFGGAITFDKARRPCKAAQAVPLDRLLIETDCPYMTPVPHRGKRNDPGFVTLACDKLAELHGLPSDEMARITLENGKRLFGIT